MKYFLLFIALTQVTFSQIRFTITSNKPIYEYGETIILTATAKNTSTKTHNIEFSCLTTMQAEFKFNDYYSGNWTSCFTSIAEVALKPNQSRNYEWIIDPKVFGLPDRDSIQTIIGRFFYMDSSSIGNYILRDTISIIAPKYYGGQLTVYFDDSLSTEIAQIRQNLNAKLLLHEVFNNYFTHETWQLTGISVDSVVNLYNNDSRFIDINYKRESSYSSITTSADDELAVSKFNLSQNYPNPFNPNTIINYSLPASSKVTLEVYNSLGQLVSVLENGIKSAGVYDINWNAESLPSGVYFIRINALESDSKKSHTHVTKALLLK